MSVKRYGVIVFTNRGGERDAKMGQLVSGEWVQHKDYAALEERLRVSEAKRQVECKAANDWQERYEAMKRIADAYHARLEGGDDERSTVE